MKTSTYIGKAIMWAATVAAMAVATATPAQAASPPRLEAPTVSFLASPLQGFGRDTMSGAGRRRLAALAWRARRFAVAGGDSVNVKVSPAYASDAGTAQRWADFFASLVHGPELGLLTAYVAPLDEVQQLCGEHSLGCYWANRLVIVGDSSGGIAPASVAAHEYGHHVANNRVNPPWRAIDWGTKRWASYMNICARVAQGTAFPGDEDAAYELNPGEAFAESYRVLNERDRGLPFIWPIVDASFIPDTGALQALREDVVNPWTASTTRTIRVRFTGSRRVWTQQVTTPLDGQLSATSGGSNDIQLIDDGHSVARGTWTTGGGKALAYQVCGRRSVGLRVARVGTARTIMLKLTQP
jgi:hypothetical protein